MKTVGVVTFLSLLVTLGTGRPGKHFLVETEANDTGNEVARFNARFNAPNVEEYEGPVQACLHPPSYPRKPRFRDVLILHSLCRPPCLVIN